MASPKMTTLQIENEILNLSNWTVQNDKLHKQYHFGSFILLGDICVSIKDADCAKDYYLQAGDIDPEDPIFSVKMNELKNIKFTEPAAQEKAPEPEAQEKTPEPEAETKSEDDKD